MSSCRSAAGRPGGVESYSIKRLEPLVGYARQMDLRQARENLMAFEFERSVRQLAYPARRGCRMGCSAARS